MPTQQELDKANMACAEAYALLSKARRKRVGAVLVTRDGVTLPGVNGTPRGLSNECERVLEDGALESFSHIIHAELNCILKAAREGVSVKGSVLYTTLSPCMACSAMLIQAGVERVVYKDVYRNTEGLDMLLEAGIIVEHLITEDHHYD